MKIIHLTFREGMSSVFMAQVVKPMGILKARGRDIGLLVFAPAGEMLRPPLRKRWKKRLEEIRCTRGLNVSRLPSPPSRLRALWSEAPLLRLWLRLRLARQEPALLHCRGHQAALLALSIKATMPGLRVLFDCRGVNGAEYAYVRGHADIEQAPREIAARAREIEAAERRAAVASDAMICVSEAMKQHVMAHWAVPESKITVVPCCTDVEAAGPAIAARAATRRRLGLESRFVVAYSGSLEAWQVPQASLEWFKRIADLRPDAHLLAITTHPERMNEFARAAGIPKEQRTVLTVPQAQVAEYLAAADCGLLVRESTQVNRVASPVKFAEYLAAGVPVLISEGVGDYTEVVRLENLGAVLPAEVSGPDAAMVLQNFLKRLKAEDGSELARRCNEYAAMNLSWERAAEGVEEIFQASHLLPSA